MAARKTRFKTGDLKVTVELNGWPAEKRMLSVVDACWYVDLKFQDVGPGGMIRVLRQATYDSYEPALAKYQQLVGIFG